MIRHFSLFCLNILWKTVAIIVVGAAVFVSVVRFMLPGIDEHREEIAAWVSKQVAQPVEFDRISAEWRGWTPVIELSNFRLKDKTDTNILTRFEKASISIDVRRSFRRREFIPGHLTVSGVQISLARGDDGTIRVEGIAPQDVRVSSLQQNALAYWLQMQRQITIESAAITWRDQKSLFKPLFFSNVTLSIRSDGERRQLEGTARLPDAPGSRFRFLLDARGDLLTPLWSGELYIEGHAIEPSMLLEYSRWMGFEMAGGQLDFRVWTEWKNARLMDVTGEFSAAGVDIGTHTQRVHVATLGGAVSARRDTAESWYMTVENLNVTTANGSWPESAISIALVKPDDQAMRTLVANASFLRLEDIAPLITDIPALPPAVRDTFTTLRPRGDLREIRLGYFPEKQANQRFLLRTHIGNLASLPAGGFPGVQGLGGELSADLESGTVELSGNALRLDFGEVFNQPLRLVKSEGTVSWRRRDAAWEISTDGVRFATADASAEIAGSIDWAPEHPPQVNLRAGFGEGRLEHLPDYLPRGLLPEKAYEWLQHAIPRGRIVSGGGVLRGPLDRFPFDEHDGRFEIRVNLADATLEYSPYWPRVEGLDAEVVFEGRGLSVNAARGRTLEAELGPTRARIENLTVPQHTVTIEGTAHGSVAAGKSYVMASPLKDTLAGVVESAADNGSLSLDLRLQVPLYPDAAQFQGRVTLADAGLHAADLGIDIDNLEGTIGFSRTAFSATAVSGRYLGHPVLLGLDGNLANGTVNTAVSIDGRTDRAFLIERLHELTPAVAAWIDQFTLLDHAEGETDWRVSLKTRRSGDALKVEDLRIESSLSGLSVALPPPFSKEGHEKRPMTIHVDLSGGERRNIDFSLGEAVDGSLVLARDPAGTSRLERAAIRLGGAAVQPPATPGVWIGGNVDLVSVSDWTDLLHQHVTVDPATATSAPPLPVAVDIKAARVETLGRMFENVAIRGDSGTDHWTFDVAGDQIEGQVTIPHALAQGITQINLRRLLVTPRTGDSDKRVRFDPSHIPAVSAHCEQFTFETIEFGKADLATRPAGSGLRLESLTFDSPAAHITAQGDWQYKEDIHTSRFGIRVTTPGLGRLLQRFGYGVTSVQGGRTAIDIDASWGGTPAEFTLEKLNGSLAMNIKEGRFLDIDSPAAGRLFGLMNLQTLPRLLLLDFNDLFKKGMSFDKITGTFELDHGNAYTNNLTMEGPSARIEVTGRTGLAGKDYDQLATVTPQVSDSLPVASALFGPAGAGVGAAIYLGKKLFKELPEQIDKMLSKQYSITGRWENPVIEPLKEGTSAPATAPANG